MRTRDSRVVSAYPVNSTGPPTSSTARYADRSVWPVLRAFASAFARVRCSVINRRNSSASTVKPCSAAISRVRSIGNPYVSCSANARSPDSSDAPADFVSTIATSRIVVPLPRVERNVSSSPYAYWLIRSKSLATSG